MTPLVLAVVLTVLQAVDGWTTYQILKRGGREENPIVRWMIDRLGDYEALLFTKCCAVVLVWLLYWIPLPEVAHLWLLGALGVGYVIVAAYNYNVLCKMKERG